MRHIAKALALAFCLILLLQSVALADTGKIGKEYTIDGECSFTVKSIKPYDVFFNEESGDSKTWIAVTIDLLNLRNDSFYVKTEAKAKVVYDDDFDYTNDYLWPSLEGSYYCTNSKAGLYINSMDEIGILYCSGMNVDHTYGDKSTISKPFIQIGNIMLYNYSYHPEGVFFDTNNKGIDDYNTYKSTDPSKTVLDPLVKRTYHYIFLVPDLVAEEEGARELVFTVCGEEYSFRF